MNVAREATADSPELVAEIQQWQSKAAQEVERRMIMPTRFEEAAVNDLTGDVEELVLATLRGLPEMPRPETSNGRCVGVLTHEIVVRRQAEAVSRVRPPLGFALCGPPGVGKTFAAAAFLNAATRLLVPGDLISAPALLDGIKASWSRTDRNDLEKDPLDRYRRAPLLCLDDLDKVRPTEWTLETLFGLVNARYESGLPLIVTSNCTLDGLRGRFAKTSAEFADAISDRLFEMTAGRWLKMSGPSHRVGDAALGSTHTLVPLSERRRRRTRRMDDDNYDAIVRTVQV